MKPMPEAGWIFRRLVQQVQLCWPETVEGVNMNGSGISGNGRSRQADPGKQREPEARIYYEGSPGADDPEDRASRRMNRKQKALTLKY